MLEERVKKKLDRLQRRPLSTMAFWQFLGFVLLLSFLWANEVLDLPVLIFGGTSEAVDIIGTCLLTAGIILIGFVTVAHTLVQQRKMLKGFVTVCSYCGKVHIDENAWGHMEEFIAERSLLEFSHGICPVCYQKLLKDNKLDAGNGRKAAS